MFGISFSLGCILRHNASAENNSTTVFVYCYFPLSNMLIHLSKRYFNPSGV